MTPQGEHFYEFDRFRVDAERRLLLRDGVVVPLTPKAFDTLLVLVRHSGRVLDKQELMRELWPDSFVEEANLNVQISTLRKALGESPHERRYIITVPGRGYRFAAGVTAASDEVDEIVVEELTRSRIVIEEREAEEGEPAGAAGKPAPVSAVRDIATRHGSRRRTLVVAAVAVAVLAAAVAGALYLFTGAGKPPPFERVQLSKLTTAGTATAAAISPDGRHVAFVTSEAGARRIWLRQTATDSAVEVYSSNDAGLSGLVFSPDGDYVYFLRSALNSPVTLHRAPSLGGAVTKLAEDVDTPITLSPDGTRMAYLRGYPDRHEAALVLANSDGTNESSFVTFKDTDANNFLNGSPAWSPDGKTILYSRREVDGRGEYYRVMALRTEGGAEAAVTNQRWQSVGRVAWLPDSSSFLMPAADESTAPARQIWLVSYPSGDARKISNDLEDYRDLSVAADGKAIVAVQADQRANIWVAPGGDAARARQLTFSNYDGAGGLAWSPGGELVYATRESGNWDLRVAGKDGRAPRPLTVGKHNDRHPAVAPDGKTIVFSSDQDGGRNLWRVDSDGGARRRLTDGADDVEPAFSPDGRWVVYKSYAFVTPNILRVAAEGGRPVRLTEKISGRPAISPDGEQVACVYRDPALSPYRLALVPFDGGAPALLSETSNWPIQWTPDGKALTFIKTEGGVSNIWSQPVDGGPPQRLTDFRSERIFWFAWSAGGDELACARGVVVSDVVLLRDEGAR